MNMVKYLVILGQEDYDKLSILKVYLWSNLLIVLYNLLALFKVIVNVHLRRQTELENERLVSNLINNHIQWKIP